MNIYPAIDLYGGKAVRLVRGDYAQMTVYSDDPAALAAGFSETGASFLHMVDLEGAKSGSTPNLGLISEIAAQSGLFCEVGGGIRSPEIIEKYISAGVKRIILGSAAVTDPGFRREAIAAFGEKIAVGADILDGYAAIHGWQEKSPVRAEEFFDALAADGADADEADAAEDTDRTDDADGNTADGADTPSSGFTPDSTEAADADSTAEAESGEGGLNI